MIWPRAPNGKNKPVEEVVKGTFGKNQGLFNNAGQHYNHTHFWKWMKPGGGGYKIPGELEKKFIADLGSVANMKEEFSAQTALWSTKKLSGGSAPSGVNRGSKRNRVAQ